jgi:hypothetical protein
MRLSYRARTRSTCKSPALTPLRVFLVFPLAGLAIACSSASPGATPGMGPGPGCTSPDGGVMGHSGTDGGPGGMPDAGLSGHSGSEGGPPGNLPEGGLSGHTSGSSDGGC